MKILDSEINLIINLKQSIYQYKLFWLLFFLSVVFDALSTVFFMKIEGIEYEANVMIRNLATSLGMIPGVILGKSLQVFVAMIFSSLSFKLSRAILLLLTALNLLASFHNVSSVL